MTRDAYDRSMLSQLLGLVFTLAVLLTIYHLRQGVPFEAIVDDPALLVRGMFDQPQGT